MLSIKCPNCGGTVQFDENHIITFCSFCGSQLPDMSSYVEQAMKLSVEEKRHNMEMQKMEKQMKRDALDNKLDAIGLVLKIIGVGIFMFFFFKIMSLIP